MNAENRVEELGRRLDSIVNLLLVVDTFQGARCAHCRGQARRVISIARGEAPGAGGGPEATGDLPSDPVGVPF